MSWATYALGDFFTNSSGHPAGNPQKVSGSAFLIKHFFLSTPSEDGLETKDPLSSSSSH
jgi:hypothetical protein